MLVLKDDHWNDLPQETQNRVNKFIDWLKNIKRFKPSKDLGIKEVDKQAKFVLDCFGVKAEIEYRKLDGASAWESARACVEILLQDDKGFKEKYPNGAFRQLFKLREMWLHPVWVLKETGTFVIYVPPCDWGFPDLFGE